MKLTRIRVETDKPLTCTALQIQSFLQNKKLERVLEYLGLPIPDDAVLEDYVVNQELTYEEVKEYVETLNPKARLRGWDVFELNANSGGV